MINNYDKYLFHEGKHINAYNFMGAHIKIEEKKRGVRFTTWAPKAISVSVVGDYNNWNINDGIELEKVSENGIWSGFIKGINKGCKYKFAIKGRDGNVNLKSDPYGRLAEVRPNTASVVDTKNNYRWTDRKWVKRKYADPFKSPINIYEMHLGSWRTKFGEFLSYEELAEELPSYLEEMGYTHVEFLPVMEHPLDKSWGYQITNFYAPTSRFGDGNGLRTLINAIHNKNIGVILDWVPGHFCRDSHGISSFDGEATYEYEEGWKSDNKGWGTLNFDLGRPEVKSFLISNAMYWLKEFHIDGFRMDAVSNMVYLNYGRKDGEWFANSDGSNINKDAVDFIKEVNEIILEKYPNTILCAEESTTFNKVSFPVSEGGLGFHFKWNMGWMNDTLEYVEIDPIFKKYAHNKMNFAMAYHYDEHFILPLSHDEVVHGKKSLVNKMHGDYFNKFAGLRAYMTYTMGHPGKKLLFMGSEFGQFIEWREYEDLDWHLPKDYKMHGDTSRFFKDLNKIYKENNALWLMDYETEGFKWIEADNGEQSIYIFMRQGVKKSDTLIFLINFTPVYYENYEIGVPFDGKYKELFNSDREIYGGSNKVNLGMLKVTKESRHNMDYSVNIKVPPMGAVILKFEGE